MNTPMKSATVSPSTFGGLAGRAAGLLIVLTLMTGVLYPLAVTAVARLAFPAQANGSLIVSGNHVVGSALVGQAFEDPKHFWGRVSATSPAAYNGSASTGSNLGPTNPALTKVAKARVDALRAADPGNAAPIPVDLVTASASGLDPHISPAAAEYQVRRVAAARALPEAVVREAVSRFTEGREFGILGEPRVNVLRLNLDLDGRMPR